MTLLLQALPSIASEALPRPTQKHSSFSLRDRDRDRDEDSTDKVLLGC